MITLQFWWRKMQNIHDQVHYLKYSLRLSGTLYSFNADKIKQGVAVIASIYILISLFTWGNEFKMCLLLSSFKQH